MNKRSILQGSKNEKEWGIERKDRDKVVIRLRSWRIEKENYNQSRSNIEKAKEMVDKQARRIIDNFPDILKDNVEGYEIQHGDKNYFYIKIFFDRPGRVY